MWALLKKELWTYFGSPGAYIVALVFVLISALFLWFLDTDYNVFNIGNANLKSFFQIAPWLWLFLVPALTMRTLAEESNNGTLAWLFSKPIRTPSIIGAKFWSLVILIIFCLLPTSIFIYTVSELSIPKGNIDHGVIKSSYFGLFLLNMAFIAVGIWTSSMTNNVVYAYLIALFTNFILYFGLEKIASFDSFGSLDFFIKKLGFSAHYSPFVHGMIDTRDVFYFVFVILLFLGLTFISLKKQK